jgi:hypothetical protein
MPASHQQRYKGAVMDIHSKFLVHWTGNGKHDIESKPESDRPQLYFDRLIDDYQYGLYTKRTSEDVIRNWKIKKIVRLCFTEIRLSQAEKHAERYGKLGIGFTRDFIMNKGGRPVIYIPYKADGRLLEDSIKSVYEKSKDNEEIHKSSKWIMAHVKRMSDGNSEDYYEEMEWRLVYDESPDNKHFTKGKGKGIHRLKFAAHDIKVIIFPDEDTKELSLKTEAIRKYFSEYMPIIATLEDCRNF